LSLREQFKRFSYVTEKSNLKLLFLATEDWSFCQHFLVMAQAARSAGFDVAVATRVQKHGGQIISEGLRLIPLEVRRGNSGTIEGLLAIKNIARVVRAERADIVHCIGLPMAVFGGIAARLMGVKKIILAPTGLGHLWISENISDRLLRILVQLSLGWLLKGRRVHYLFENSEDPKQFALTEGGGQLTIVGGAGVDPKEFPVTAEPPFPPVKIAVVSRMLRGKGIAEAVEATQIAIAKGADVELHLYGDPDPFNPGTLLTSELLAFSALRGIHWHGQTEDITKVWREHHIGMLLSYREGLPKSLVEAAASGRPLITSDVAGCREVVRDGVEGFLITKRDVVQAADKIVQLAQYPDLRKQMGIAANERFRNKFTAERLRKTMASLYLRLVE
jgi:glycosyltransferase involved in cell wall biosynthesis